MDTDRISADELAYHQAIQLQVMVTNAIVNHWSQHLSRKYVLGPQDRIAEDGVIVRAGAAARES